MVQIRPFKAIRPTPELASQIASLPYDVINSEEARDLVEDNDYSYLHIDKSEVDLPTDTDPYSSEVYEKAKVNLQQFQKNNWLIQDEFPDLYIYELTMDGRPQTGLVACTSIQDYLDNKIKKHEFTRPEKELDRIMHSDICNANTSPIFLTYREVTPITELINDWKSTHNPIYSFASFHNVKHQVWIIDEQEKIDSLQHLFSIDVPSLYIADGHHRTESAVKVGKRRLDSFPDASPNSEFNFFLSVLFPKDELEILDYNRVLNVPIPNDFFDKLQEKFDLSELTTIDKHPTSQKEFSMYLDNKWYLLKANESIVSQDNIVNSLDVSILQTNILNELFGIEDVRTDKRIDFVGGIRGLTELEKLVDSGDYSIAFALYPTSMDQLLEVADDEEIMPPKSTWFEPKLLSGLFIHDLS